MVAVLHRVVVGRVVAWRAREKGGRAESLFDDWLLLEGVERRREGRASVEAAGSGVVEMVSIESQVRVLAHAGEP